MSGRSPIHRAAGRQSLQPNLVELDQSAGDQTRARLKPLYTAEVSPNNFHARHYLNAAGSLELPSASRGRERAASAISEFDDRFHRPQTRQTGPREDIEQSVKRTQAVRREVKRYLRCPLFWHPDPSKRCTFMVAAHRMRDLDRHVEGKRVHPSLGFCAKCITLHGKQKTKHVCIKKCPDKECLNAGTPPCIHDFQKGCCTDFGRIHLQFKWEARMKALLPNVSCPDWNDVMMFKEIDGSDTLSKRDDCGPSTSIIVSGLRDSDTSVSQDFDRLMQEIKELEIPQCEADALLMSVLNLKTKVIQERLDSEENVRQTLLSVGPQLSTPTFDAADASFKRFSQSAESRPEEDDSWQQFSAQALLSELSNEETALTKPSLFENDLDPDFGGSEGYCNFPERPGTDECGDREERLNPTDPYFGDDSRMDWMHDDLIRHVGGAPPQ